MTSSWVITHAHLLIRRLFNGGMHFSELGTANSDPIYLGPWTAKSDFFMLPLQSGILQAPLISVSAQQHQLFSSGHYRARCHSAGESSCTKVCWKPLPDPSALISASWWPLVAQQHHLYYARLNLEWNSQTIHTGTVVLHDRYFTPSSCCALCFYHQLLWCSRWLCTHGLENNIKRTFCFAFFFL